MSIRIALPLLLLGASFAGFGARLGGAAWILGWPAMSFIAVSVAYLSGHPRILGKRADGTIAAWAWLALGPYLLLTWGVWRALCRFSDEEAVTEVAPGIWVGRRPLAHEVPTGVHWIVDLTAELPAITAIRQRPGYLCVPVLDGTAPGARVLRSILDRIRGPEDVLFHCAAGHGRSATVAAALLLDRGLASDAVSGESMLRRARPGVRLNAAQRRVLES